MIFTNLGKHNNHDKIHTNGTETYSITVTKIFAIKTNGKRINLEQTHVFRITERLDNVLCNRIRKL